MSCDQPIQIIRNSFQTIFFQVNQQQTPTSPVSAYDFSSVTATFAVAYPEPESNIVIVKSSTSVNEIFYTSATAGQLEVYINNTDTLPLQPGKYWFSLYTINTVGRKYNLVFDRFVLSDNLNY